MFVNLCVENGFRKKKTTNKQELQKEKSLFTFSFVND